MTLRDPERHKTLRLYLAFCDFLRNGEVLWRAWQGDALPLSYSRLSTVDSNDSTLLVKYPQIPKLNLRICGYNKRCNAKGDYPVTLHRCFNPKPHAGTGAQPSSLCFAV